MLRYIFFAAILFFVFPNTESAGFLKFELTADRDCLLHLEHSSTYSETVRLLAYESRPLEIYTQGSINEIPVHFQLLHHFSGKALSEAKFQIFQLKNNGLWDSKVIDTDKVILSVRSTFYCENGYFGPICDRRSRTFAPKSDIQTSTPGYQTQVLKFDFKISDE